MKINKTPILDSNLIFNALGKDLQSQHGDIRTFNRAVIDSREVKPGDLFVALPGDTTDGHLHAASAIAAGANGCLLEKHVEGTETGTLFFVNNTLNALQKIAAFWRQSLNNLNIIGVTGNVGKTTTKILTAELIASKYNVEYSKANYNNEIGVPLCLLEIKPNIDFSVIEMGMYTTNEISLLCQWSKPKIGIVLNVGPVHLERAGSIENIIKAKQELVEALPENGVAVLNIDDPSVRKMAEHTSANVIFIGQNPSAMIRGTEIKSIGQAGFNFNLEIENQKRKIHVPLPGTHLMTNLLAASAVAHILGMDIDEIAEKISTLDSTLRTKISTLPGNILLLDDTYNASPASMHAAINLLSELPGRHFALLGDMLELGSESQNAHEEIGKRAAQDIDVLFTIGDLGLIINKFASKSGDFEATHITEKNLAAQLIANRLKPGDAILIKGSRGLRLENIASDLSKILREIYPNESFRNDEVNS
ncbi:MAG: UDP-N-acetylmuramoyl-tripeptide--D-alanyl-D-alanine ligase [Dehalococcoidia bacterium]|nr:UDP-N-acetylmuramoyl-tripeptide--D-alanyl-D-alanine ligase [Dehalococcoidia bacterium]